MKIVLAHIDGGLESPRTADNVALELAIVTGHVQRTWILIWVLILDAEAINKKTVRIVLRH